MKLSFSLPLLLASIPYCAGFSAVAPTVPIRASCENAGQQVRVGFENGEEYEFHAMWLRDACRDDDHIVRGAGERLLSATPVGPLAYVDPTQLQATGVRVETDDSKDGRVVVSWNDASSVEESSFSLEFLKKYAPVVGKQVASSATNTESTQTTDTVEWSTSAENIPVWLEPFTGYPDARAPKDDEMNLWTNQDGPEFQRFDHAEVLSSDETLLKLLETLLMRDGVVLVDNVPEDDSDEARELRSFIDHALGGLQKDPTRGEPNWKIVKTPGADSISYDPIKLLYLHSDSSIPPYGIPAVVLSMHYVKGYGANTLTDAFSVAKKIRREDPEAFDLLSTYGYDGERDFAASRKDSVQKIAEGLVIRRINPIFTLDSDGEIARVQYNEVFRMPLTLPYDVFPKWYAAFSKFVSMVHSEENQRTVDMKAGTILLMNNWRVLHGRAGGKASPDRHLVGGTVVRESAYSRAMQLAQALHGKKMEY